MSPFKRHLLSTVFTDAVTQRIYMPALETEADRSARIARRKAMGRS